MSRTIRSLLLVAALVSPAAAEQKSTLELHPEMKGLGTPCVTVPMGPEAFTAPVGLISKTLYLERCRGGCTVTGGQTNNARTLTSAIPAPGSSNAFPEFTNHLGETGAAADAQWNAVVACVREVYSWYDVNVTDVKPGAGSYHLNLVSGTPGLIGLPNGTLGISPFACTAQDNIISFAFAGAHSRSSADAYVKDVCWTVSHEAGHAFSLEHEYTFLDGRSACSDPMSYPNGECNPYRYFRNDQATCGGFAQEPCSCGSAQNSHLKLLNVFGAGAPTVAKPTAAIVNPAAGAQVQAFVTATAGSRRGVARLELFVNGASWGETTGAPFAVNGGQPDPSSYSIKVPDKLPGGILDIHVRAYDDLGAYADSAVVTAAKGAPCVSADSCAKGQRCDAGKCFWDPAAGEIGDTCTFPEFCLSGLCQGTAERAICTQACIPGVVDSCPTSLDCIETNPGAGICYSASEDEGGCSVGTTGVDSDRDTSSLARLGALGIVLGVLLRRRRRAV